VLDTHRNTDKVLRHTRRNSLLFCELLVGSRPGAVVRKASVHSVFLQYRTQVF
jgi:hypothetical protein